MATSSTVLSCYNVRATVSAFGGRNHQHNDNCSTVLGNEMELEQIINTTFNLFRREETAYYNGGADLLIMVNL